MYVASVTLGLLNNSVSTTDVIRLSEEQSRNIIKGKGLGSIMFGR